MTLTMMLLVNLLVGACVGLTGIAGFLLPMFYSGFLGFPSVLSLALSFAAFFVSGVLGSVNYRRSGNLDISTGCLISLGSFLGAILGVRLNLLIPEAWIRTLLYLVVLGSGISILVREALAQKKSRNQNDTQNQADSLSPSAAQSRHAAYAAGFIGLGIATGAVCAASGAGGPVLVMPLLTICGFPAHMAAGIALFDSIFIALPAAGGYLQAAFALAHSADTAASATAADALRTLPLLLLFHGIGVFAGSRNAVHINQKLLKTIVATASIAIACLKLSRVI